MPRLSLYVSYKLSVQPDRTFINATTLCYKVTRVRKKRNSPRQFNGTGRTRARGLLCFHEKRETREQGVANAEGQRARLAILDCRLCKYSFSFAKTSDVTRMLLIPHLPKLSATFKVLIVLRFPVILPTENLWWVLCTFLGRRASRSNSSDFSLLLSEFCAANRRANLHWQSLLEISK